MVVAESQEIVSVMKIALSPLLVLIIHAVIHAFFPEHVDKKPFVQLQIMHLSVHVHLEQLVIQR